jgi:hypothetical protein
VVWLPQLETVAQAALAQQGAPAVSPRETALIALERASRPFVPYVAAAGHKLTVVAELSSASIQAARWKDGADVTVDAIGANGEPLARATGRLAPGAFSVAIPITVGAARPARVTIGLAGPGEQPAEDWIKVDPPSGSLVGDPVAYRAGSRITRRPVAAFEFARNERIRIEWPVLATMERRAVRLLDRTGRPLPIEIPLADDESKKILIVEMSLSGLPRADYLFELTAGSADGSERHLLAIRMKP